MSSLTAPFTLLTATDCVSLWTFCFMFILFLTESTKLSAIASTFVLANFLVVFHCFSCPRVEPEVVNKFVDGIKLIAHRGGALDAPENTLAAIQAASELGANAVEIDVAVTADGVPILMHDFTVDRTTDGTGQVETLSWEYISSLNAAAKFEGSGWRTFDVERVPKLNDAVYHAIKFGLKVFLDVKDGDPRVVSTILELFANDSSLYSLVSVCSFYHHVTYQVKRADPRVIIGHTFRPHYFAYQEPEAINRRYNESLPKHLGAVALDLVNVYIVNNWLWKFTGASLILPIERYVSKQYVMDLRANDLYPFPWTLNDVEAKLYFINTLKAAPMTDIMSDMQQ